ncbi:MAG: hypothetical protein AAB217_15760, partial [Chloroflexota bacterium]
SEPKIGKDIVNLLKDSYKHRRPETKTPVLLNRETHFPLQQQENGSLRGRQAVCGRSNAAEQER